MQTPSFSSWSTRPRDGSLSDSVRSLLSAAVLYMETRMQLMKVEAGQAVRVGVRILVLAVLIITSAFVAYVSGMVAVTLWIANTWWHGEVMPAAFIISGSHVLLAALCAGFVAWSARGHQLFHDTRKEFEEDKRWLHLQTTPKR